MAQLKKVNTLFEYPFLLFFLFLIVAYLPVLLPFFHVKNDLVTQNLPTRFFIGESLHSKTFPWWNPYINYGMPQYGDMNNGYWNPFIWLIAPLFGYNVLTITLEEMLYILMGGWGIFKLAKQLGIPQHIALVCGFCYMSGGYIMGHLQHFCWITGTAFFPYVLLFYARVLQQPLLKNFIAGGIAGFCFIAATHPGLIIGALYFFVFVFLYLLFSNNNSCTKLTAKQLVKVNVLYAGFILLFTPVVWVSDAEVLQHITRGVKVSLAESLMAPTTMQCYLSLLFPLAVQKGSFFYTDISMRNCSIGLPLLLGVFLFFRKKRLKDAMPLLCFLLFFILLAAGGLFKSFAYYYLPFLGHVRLNGEFAYFVFLLLLLMGGFGWAAYYHKEHQLFISHLLRYTQLFFVACCVAEIICMAVNKDSAFLQPFAFTTASFKSFIQNTSFLDLLLVNTIIQLLFTYLYRKLLFHKS